MKLATLPEKWIQLAAAAAAFPALSAAPGQALLDAHKARYKASRRGLLFLIASANVTIAGPVDVCGYTLADANLAIPAKWWSLGPIDGGASLSLTAGRGIVREIRWQAPFAAFGLESGAIAGGTVDAYLSLLEEEDF